VRLELEVHEIIFGFLVLEEGAVGEGAKVRAIPLHVVKERRQLRIALCWII
jgi:hypothetical protein